MLAIYNTSKKTPLTVSGITIEGANPNDFAVTPAFAQQVLSTALPAKQDSLEALEVSFTPTAEGVRSGTLRLVTNAGIVLIPLTGAGLPDRAILATAGPLSFLPASAPDNFDITNVGGQGLVLQSIAFGAQNTAFQLFVANHGLSNCFVGDILGPHSSCHLAVGLTPGAVAPANAVLKIVSNDPLNPVTKIQLTLTP